MSKEDVPVLPPNLFPYIPFIPFRARRQPITLKPIQALQQSFTLSQSISLELSLIPRLEFILTQNVTPSFLLERAIVNRLDQDIVLQVYLSSTSFILEQDIVLLYEASLDFTIDQDIEPIYEIEIDFTIEQDIEPRYEVTLTPILEQDIEPRYEVEIDFTLDQFIEPTYLLGTATTLTLEQDIEPTYLLGVTTQMPSLDQDIEVSTTLNLFLDLRLDQSIEPIYAFPIFLDLTLDQSLEPISAVGGLLAFTLDQDITLLVSGFATAIGDGLMAQGSEGTVIRLTIEGLTAVGERGS